MTSSTTNAQRIVPQQSAPVARKANHETDQMDRADA